jgi:peptide deformylase
VLEEMRLLTYPADAKALTTACFTVTKEYRESEDFKNRLNKLKEICTASGDAIGIAAIQGNWHARVVLILVDKNLTKLPEPFVIINPKILTQSSETSKVGEGCLSFPELQLKVSRPSKITWEYEDINGNTIRSEETFVPNSLPGYYIRVIQHEVDHTAGILFCDRTSATERLKFNRWLKKRENNAS